MHTRLHVRLHGRLHVRVGPVTADPAPEQLAARRALTEALRLVEHGYALTPVTISRNPTSGKKSARFHGNGLRGAQYRGWRHESVWSRDPDQIRAWWVEHADCSFALGGAANGVEGVDLDVKRPPLPAVDAVAWWRARGLPDGALTQRTPTGGLHLIWRADEHEQLPQDQAGTVATGLDTRNRSGLFFAAGAYVVGVDGQPEPGHYEVIGELPKLADLATTPDVVLALFRVLERPQRAVDGQIAVKDREWVRQATRDALRVIREHDRGASGYRGKIQGLGLFLGRLVEAGEINAETAEGMFLEAHRAVWGPAVWPENVKTFRDALADGPRLERWRLNDRTDPYAIGTASVDMRTEADGSGRDEPSGEELRALRRSQLKGAERERQEIRAEVARELAVEGMPALRVLDVDAFLDAPPLSWLVPGFLYRNDTAKIYGPPGGTKSFLVLDLALCLATGRTWHGRTLERTRVHYVMAEGQAVNALRTAAWMAHHGVDRDALRGWFVAIPQGVLLTPEGVTGYLEILERDQPGLVILDTKNRMMVGEENSASDVAVMIRAMDMIRQVSSANVTLVDHTGLSDQTRGRGSNAVQAAMGSEVRVTFEDGIGRALVTRDKAGADGLSVSYGLRGIDDVPRPPGIAPPAVCVPLSGAARVALRPDDAWWDEVPNVSEDLHKLLCSNAKDGRGVEAARWIWRALVALTVDEQAVSRVEIKRWLADSPGAEHAKTQAAVQKGCKVLEESQVIIPAGRTTVVLDPRWRPNS